MDTFSGEAIVKLFLPPFCKGSTLKGKNLLTAFRVDPVTHFQKRIIMQKCKQNATKVSVIIQTCCKIKQVYLVLNMLQNQTSVSSPLKLDV